MDDGTIRRRADASSSQSKHKAPEDEQGGTKTPPKTRRKDDEDGSGRPARGVGIMGVLRILGGLALLSSAMSWFITGDSVMWGWKPWFFQMSAMESWLVR
jgi:hypothetical protein